MKNKYLIIDDYVKVYAFNNVSTKERLYSFFIDLEDLPKLQEIKGNLHIYEQEPNKYVRFWHNGHNNSLHRYLINPPKDKLVDHIDRNGLNNRKSNLRITISNVNNRNRKISKNTKVGYNGIYIKGNKWIAEITRAGHKIYLGSYDNIKDALKERKRAMSFYWYRNSIIETLDKIDWNSTQSISENKEYIRMLLKDYKHRLKDEHPVFSTTQR